jgi:hypothetical protein
MARHSAELLFAGDANYDCRNIFHIDERVEIFRAGQIRKVDDTVSHLGDFAAHFFSRSEVQLDRFARAGLKDASDSRIRLQAGFILRERAGDQQTAGRFISHWQAQRLPYNFA